MELLDLEIAKRKAVKAHVKADMRADAALDEHIAGKLSREKLEEALAAKDEASAAFYAACDAVREARQ